ncbi:MAG: hypothetical protein WAK51_11800 [Opitutaceae bacterium]
MAQEGHNYVIVVPRKKNRSPTTKFRVSTSSQNAGYLAAMEAMGIWGKTRSEIVERLIGAEVERLIRERFLELKKPNAP